jgi:hypothetical protein
MESCLVSVVCADKWPVARTTRDFTPCTIHYIIQVVVGDTFLVLHKVMHAISFSYQIIISCSTCKTANSSYGQLIHFVCQVLSTSLEQIQSTVWYTLQLTESRSQ